MARAVESSPQATDPAVRIDDLYLSVRTSNRLRKMGVIDLGQIARVAPRDFLKIEGFGKKCLYEIAETLEKFYSSLDVSLLASFADVVELWRPYFSHPERVPVAPYELSFPNPGQSASSASEAVREPFKAFDPARNPQAQMLVEDLPISARARNVLSNARIRTLNDLARISPVTLVKSENCGRRTIAEFATFLKGYFASLPSSSVVFYRETRASWLRYATSAAPGGECPPPILLQPEVHPLVGVIEAIFAKLGDRNTSILIKRMGLSRGHSRKTLEAIGREFHLTRERVRQVVKTALRLVLRNVKTYRPDVYQSVRELIRTLGVVSLDEVIAAVPNLGNSAIYDTEACVRAMLMANQFEIHAIDSLGRLWGSEETTPEFYRNVLKKARGVLNGISMPCEQVSLEVARSLRHFDDIQIKTIQKLLLNSYGQFGIEPTTDGRKLKPLRQNNPGRRKAFVYAYIKEQGVPIHIQEIFSALQDSEPELIPDSPSRRSAINAIASNLDRDERFAWAGQSTWGLREWGYISQGASIAPAVLEILRASSVPLSTAQIRKELSHLYRVSSAGVALALRNSKGVTIERNSEGLWRPI